MIAWVRRWWRARQRNADRVLLWPLCVSGAAERGGDLDDAKMVFLLHASMDPAWEEFEPEEVLAILNEWCEELTRH